jgi:hypothetical protein
MVDNLSSTTNGSSVLPAGTDFVVGLHVFGFPQNITSYQNTTTDEPGRKDGLLIYCCEKGIGILWRGQREAAKVLEDHRRIHK